MEVEIGGVIRSCISSALPLPEQSSSPVVISGFTLTTAMHSGIGDMHSVPETEVRLSAVAARGGPVKIAAAVVPSRHIVSRGEGCPPVVLVVGHQ